MSLFSPNLRVWGICLTKPLSLGSLGGVRGSALCILAPLLVPEVTIPEQKMSKGKGTKMAAKEKRSILLESEVSGPQECASEPSLLRQGMLANLHCGGDTQNSPLPFPCGRSLYLLV